MSFVVPHKGNGAAKDGGAVQRQQRRKRIPALLLQALTTSEADGKEWNQVPCAFPSMQISDAALRNARIEAAAMHAVRRIVSS